MFNKGFYPTSKRIARQMIDGLELQDAYILDPEAGKGDLLDIVSEHGFHSNHLYAIEIEPELRSVLEGKGYPVLAADFLTYEPTIHFTHILMNPPFADAEKHLLHAWNILYEGMIVCLLPATILEGKNSHERTIAKIVEDYGTVTPLGKAFAHAERPTDVDVVMVKLIKTADGPKLEWDVKNDRVDPEFNDTEQALAPNGFIRNLMAHYTAALGNYAEYNSARQKIKTYIAPFGTVWSGDKSINIMDASDEKDTPPARYNCFVELVTDAAWAKILDHPKFQAILTERARNSMKEFRLRQRRLDFNEHNIQAMFQELVAKQEEFLMAPSWMPSTR